MRAPNEPGLLPMPLTVWLPPLPAQGESTNERGRKAEQRLAEVEARRAQLAKDLEEATATIEVLQVGRFGSIEPID